MTTSASTQPAVTRTEIIDRLAELFSAGRELSKQDLIDAAERSGARPAVTELLRLLPGRSYWDPRQLWVDLPDIPVEL